MRVFNKVAQRSENWFRLRAGRPTASQFFRIITPAGNDSEARLRYAYALSDSLKNPEQVTWEGNIHTDRGEALEPEARELFCRATGHRVIEVGFVIADDGVCGCSPDGIVVDDDGNWIGPLEIKSPIGEIHLMRLEKKQLPDDHKCQVHGAMVVLKCRKAFYMSYAPGHPALIVVVYWDTFTDKLRDALQRFIIFYAGVREGLKSMASQAVIIDRGKEVA